MRTIALIPVYNEAATLVPVLESVSPCVDSIVVVDDGSSDDSLALARDWAARRGRVDVLRLPENRGMASALREGFAHLVARLQDGTLGADDLLVTIDADGQHDSREIEALRAYVEANRLDVALTCRDFSLYPRHKRLGNQLMSIWGTVWSGRRYKDIESGFRAMRLEVLPPLLDYYTGFRYSCAQEIAVLTSRMGFRVDNDFVTVIRLYRSQTGLRDVLINAFFGFWAFARWALRRKRSARRVPSAHAAASERS